MNSMFDMRKKEVGMICEKITQHVLIWRFGVSFENVQGVVAARKADAIFLGGMIVVKFDMERKHLMRMS